MRTVNIGVVGCGEVAQRVYLPEFHRLNDKDLKALMTDRNIQEGLRVLARKIVTKGQKG